MINFATSTTRTREDESRTHLIVPTSFFVCKLFCRGCIDWTPLRGLYDAQHVLWHEEKLSGLISKTGIYILKKQKEPDSSPIYVWNRNCSNLFYNQNQMFFIKAKNCPIVLLETWHRFCYKACIYLGGYLRFYTRIVMVWRVKARIASRHSHGNLDFSQYQYSSKCCIPRLWSIFWSNTGLKFELAMKR
jgi:hypothetical protein